MQTPADNKKSPSKHTIAEGKFLLSVGIYVVKTFRGILIARKSCKKQKKTPEIRRFQVFFWSC